MVSAGSEGQVSDIFIDPAVLKTNEALAEYLQKVLALSFTLMISMHQCEVDYYRPKADSKSILTPQAVDPITLKPVH